MTLSRERRKTPAIEMAVLMPPPDPQEAAEHRLLNEFRKLDDAGRRKIDDLVRSLWLERV